MSRAFVKESDEEDVSALPERPVSEHPNLVTPAGLQQIEARIRALESERETARAAEDKGALARIARDLRYWNARRANARVIEPATERPDTVRFGMRVTVRFEDGTERSFRLVGEDEADPPRGAVSWVSPVATALLGRSEGERVNVVGRDAEIVLIEA